MTLRHISEYVPAVGQKVAETFQEAALSHRQRGEHKEADACLRKAQITRLAYGLSEDPALPSVMPDVNTGRFVRQPSVEDIAKMDRDMRAKFGNVWQRPSIFKKVAQFEQRYIPEPNSGCWLWTRAIANNGYPVFWTHLGSAAHRFSYWFFVGDIPDGLSVDHICRVRCCVNPHHLRLMSIGDNALIGRSVSAVNGRKTHCPNGHAYIGANVKVSSTTGARSCKTCQRRRAGSVGIDQAERKHCPYGHPYDSANTRVDKRGHRHCRICARIQDRAWKIRRRCRDAELPFVPSSPAEIEA